MRFSNYYLIIFTFFFSSCGILQKQNDTEKEVIRQENRKLKHELEELSSNSYHKTESRTITPATKKSSVKNTGNHKVGSIGSQLNDLEKIIKRDALLSKKFAAFKKGGMENYIDVSSVDMERVIAESKKYLGAKHVMGGLSRSGIDCSGLLYVSFKNNGITDIPRTAQDFARLGTVIINTHQLIRGDLVFFTKTYNTSKLITHAGIYMGNGDFIHTSSSKGVTISKLNDPYYWKDKFLFGTRIVR